MAGNDLAAIDRRFAAEDLAPDLVTAGVDRTILVQTLSTLTGRSFLLMRNEQLGSTTAVILLVLAVSIVVGSTWLARRLGGST